MSPRKIKIHLEQVPLQGDTLKDEIDVPIAVESTTIHIIAESQKLSLKHKNIFVNGQPADENSSVKEGDVVRFTERPRGS
jgi:ribosomal protein S17